ncbi:hypothetical protein ACFQ73_20085 [Amycolatopsis japonica]|uniref:hypothetical protein n=1 Tax=Amycolatopsis japonica TaxID=208439 RepID=UPI0036702412
MNPVFNRRTALRGAVVLAGLTSLQGTATETASADGFKELTWKLIRPSSNFQLMPVRVISGIPTTIGYGKPVAIGPVIVQATCDKNVGPVARSTGCDMISAVFDLTVVVTDARGLSGRFPVTVQFPRTEVPATQVEFVFTGTAALTGTGTPPAARNPGPMRITVDRRVTGVTTLYNMKTGAPHQLASQADLMPPDQDPLIATIEVR